MYKIDEKFPDYELEVYLPDKKTTGRIGPKETKGKWVVLVFYPADFTFVCPTELADLQEVYPELEKMGAVVAAVSTDTVYSHKAWLETEQLLHGVSYAVAADHNGQLSRELGIYDDGSGMARRVSFIIDPDGILRVADAVADSIGRNARELVRKLKALQFVRSHPGNVCPLKWEETGAIKPSVKKAGAVYQELKRK